jgi:hypothetical protein
MNMKNWVKLFNSHKFGAADLDTQLEAGWINFDCRIESLKFKTITLGKLVEKLLPSKKLEPNKQYICFSSYLNKEEGKTYDEIWISDCATKETIWVVSIRDKKVFHCKDEFENPVFVGKTMGQVIKWFISGALKGYEKPFN